MLGAGFLLALLGMCVVFLFLIVLVGVVQLSSRMLATQTALELATAEASASTLPVAGTGLPADRRRLVAVISAAIAAHRAARRANSS